MKHYTAPRSVVIALNLDENIASSGEAFRLRGWRVGDEENAIIDCGTSEEIMDMIRRILAGE